MDLMIVKPPLRVLLLLFFFSCDIFGDSNEHMISLLRNEPSAYLCGGTPPTVVALVKLKGSSSIRVFEVFVEDSFEEKNIELKFTTQSPNRAAFSDGLYRTRTSGRLERNVFIRGNSIFIHQKIRLHSFEHLLLRV